MNPSFRAKPHHRLRKLSSLFSRKTRCIEPPGAAHLEPRALAQQIRLVTRHDAGRHRAGPIQVHDSEIHTSTFGIALYAFLTFRFTT